MSSLHRVVLKAGTCISVEGVPAELTADAEVETASADLLQKLRTDFQEYPKMLADGTVVQSKAEETAHDKAPVPADPLDDVTIEMDHAAFQADESPEARQRLAEASAALARGEEPTDTRTAAEKKADKKAAAQ